jgi:hypothetical protein
MKNDLPALADLDVDGALSERVQSRPTAAAAFSRGRGRRRNPGRQGRVHGLRSRPEHHERGMRLSFTVAP